MLDAYQTSKNNYPDYFKYDVFPDRYGLLPWGYTENGDELYWKMNPLIDKWEIVLYESASPESYNYKMSLSEFLYKIFTNNIICDVFPDNLFGTKVRYVAVNVK